MVAKMVNIDAGTRLNLGDKSICLLNYLLYSHRAVLHAVCRNVDTGNGSEKDRNGWGVDEVHCTQTTIEFLVT